ncbi:MAG: FAD-dependent oxidoreductase [Bacteroidota bacterium]
MNNFETDVLIVGAGPAGMAAALELLKLNVGKITIVDRDKEAGGLPHLTDHIGFGMRDIHRAYSGPSYANYYIKKIKNSTIQLLVETTVTGWDSNNKLNITTPSGLGTITAKAVLLTTGCRERPRTARLIPGSRPQGIYNTGALQDFVFEYKKLVGKKAVIIGAELVSYSAIHTLRKAGCKPILMTTEFEKHQITIPYLPFKWWSSNWFNKVPLEKNCKISNIYGKDKVEGIELTNDKTGNKKQIDCDTVILTGDWIPDHEMARLGTIEINEKTNGPLVDGQLRTSNEGVFAAGNLLRGAEPSDIAALEGRHVAKSISKYLEKNDWFQNRIKINVDEPIKWITPNAIELNSYNLPLNRFLFRVTDFMKNKTLKIKQGEELLYSKTFKLIIPNFSQELSGEWQNRIKGISPITITLE